MDKSFDPYHLWLSIPLQDQPPNHYRLLGLVLFEADPQVIESAADQRMSYVRTFQIGPHAMESQKVLNEIAAAKLCLLNPAKKTAYDARFANVQREPTAPPAPPVSEVEPPQFFEPQPQQLSEPAPAAVEDFAWEPEAAPPANTLTDESWPDHANEAGDLVSGERPEPQHATLRLKLAALAATFLVAVIATAFVARPWQTSVAKPAGTKPKVPGPALAKVAPPVVKPQVVKPQVAEPPIVAIPKEDPPAKVEVPAERFDDDLIEKERLAAERFARARQAPDSEVAAAAPEQMHFDEFRQPAPEALPDQDAPLVVKPAQNVAPAEAPAAGAPRVAVVTKMLDAYRVTFPSGRQLSSMTIPFERKSVYSDTSARSVRSTVERPPGMTIGHTEGLLEGNCSLLDPRTRKVEVSVSYDDGKKHGQAMIWNDDGNLGFWCEYEKGKRSRFACLFENKFPSLIVEYKADKVQGIHAFSWPTVLGSFDSADDADEPAKARLAMFSEFETRLKKHELAFKKQATAEEAVVRSARARAISEERQAISRAKRAQRAAQQEALRAAIRRASGL